MNYKFIYVTDIAKKFKAVNPIIYSLNRNTNKGLTEKKIFELISPYIDLKLFESIKHTSSCNLPFRPRSIRIEKNNFYCEVISPMPFNDLNWENIPLNDKIEIIPEIIPDAYLKLFFNIK